jgi:hypothetical protein
MYHNRSLFVAGWLVLPLPENRRFFFPLLGSFAGGTASGFLRMRFQAVRKSCHTAVFPANYASQKEEFAGNALQTAVSSAASQPLRL